MHSCIHVHVLIYDCLMTTQLLLFSGSQFIEPGSEPSDSNQIDAATTNDVQPSSISVSRSSSIDGPYHPAELKLCTDFIEATCGCKK